VDGRGPSADDTVEGAARAAGPKRGWGRRVASWWGKVHWYLLGALAVVVFVLGIIGFLQWYDAHGATGATVWDAAYESLQLFILESGSAEPPIPAALNIARFLGALAFFLGATAAVFAIFGEQLARLRLRRAEGHAVVCGLGDRGLHIAARLLRAGWRVAAIELDEDAPSVDRARADGAVVVIGDATDATVLRRVRADHASRVYAVCPNEGDNAEIVVRLRELAGDVSQDGPVEVYAHIYDTELCTLLREQEARDGASRDVRVQFFNVPERGARAMLDSVPPVARYEGAAPHIVVVGLGKLGRSLVMLVARDWRETLDQTSPRPRVTMIDVAAEDKRELLRLRMPEIDDVCELIPLKLPKNAPEFERGAYLRDSDGVLDVDAVYVCPDDDVHSLAAGLTIQRHTRDAGIPIVVRMTREGGLASLLLGARESAFGDLKAVGVLDQACDPDHLAAG
jgi:hypothetical protein